MNLQHLAIRQQLSNAFAELRCCLLLIGKSICATAGWCATETCGLFVFIDSVGEEVVEIVSLRFKKTPANS